MTAADYSSSAVEGAACLLAFAPGAEGEVLYQAAFARGRDVPVVLVVSVDEDVSRFDPKPFHVVEIEFQSPNAICGAEESITRILSEIAQSLPAATTGAPRSPRPSPERAGGTAVAMVSAVDQAESLFEAFVADGLSERLIHRLLLEAGCRESWVEFRIQQQFGGW